MNIQDINEKTVREIPDNDLVEMHQNLSDKIQLLKYNNIAMSIIITNPHDIMTAEIKRRGCFS